MTTAIQTRNFELVPWQQAAVDAWVQGDGRGAYRGTLEIVTGGGKTLIALACAERAAAVSPELRVAIVVPTEALARQWRAAALRYTTLAPDEVGILGAGESASLRACKALVAVLNTASRRLPEMAIRAQPLMLIVDECHRAGAPTFARVLRTEASFRIGLSATPDREELDDAGEPLAYDEQLVGRALGSVVYHFSLRDARLHHWLPDYQIHHHGVELVGPERQRYDAISRRVDDLADQLRAVGGDAGHAQQLQGRPGEVGQLARRYVAVTSQRKDLLYRATERSRVAHRLVADVVAGGDRRRVLLFHERVNEAVALYEQLVQELPDTALALEHSRLATGARVQAMDSFRTGDSRVLVSVKSLVEGIDVPEADVGISVASTASVRQRIQSLGRVLRKQFDDTAPPKRAEMHLIYVADSADESIYGKEDWSDLTGQGVNHYWRWPPDVHESPREMPGPPATPRPTEEQEWERLGQCPPAEPEPWLGVLTGQEYSVDTMGTVSNMFGSIVRNPQGVGRMIEHLRGRPGGRFRVTPAHRLVLVFAQTPDGSSPFVVGQLAEPFVAETAEDGTADAPSVPTSLRSGELVAGPADKRGGTYRLRQKQGGVIERRGADGALEFALTIGTGDPQREENAKRVIHAWRQLTHRGVTFYVTGDGLAWYVEGGQRRFLALVPGRFVWPAPDPVEV